MWYSETNKKAIAICISETSPNISNYSSNELTDILLEGDAVDDKKPGSTSRALQKLILTTKLRVITCSWNFKKTYKTP